MKYIAVVGFVLAVAVCVTADYSCVCNVHTVYSVKVYQEMSKDSTVIGHIDHAQCKQEVCSQSDSPWIKIEYETEFGYIDTGSMVEHRFCTGIPQARDAGPCNLDTTPLPLTHPSTTGAPTATTSTSTPSTPTTTTSTSTPSTTTTTTRAPTTTTSTTTKRTTHEPTTAITHAPPTHSSQTGTSHPSDGNLLLCPKSLRDGAAGFHDVVGQFGSKCYVLDTLRKMTWKEAEDNCAKYHGHLVHIESSQEQQFVAGFVARHAPGSSTWLGLHDRLVEGIYMWNNGGVLRYSNWAPDHYSFMTHHTDDCVLMRPDGHWDDVNCGHHIFGHVQGLQLPTLCQFEYPSIHVFG